MFYKPFVFWHSFQTLSHLAIIFWAYPKFFHILLKSKSKAGQNILEVFSPIPQAKILQFSSPLIGCSFGVWMLLATVLYWLFCAPQFPPNVFWTLWLGNGTPSLHTVCLVYRLVKFDCILMKRARASFLVQHFLVEPLWVLFLLKSAFHSISLRKKLDGAWSRVGCYQKQPHFITVANLQIFCLLSVP